MQAETAIDIPMDTEDQAGLFKDKIKEIVSIKIASLTHLSEDSLKDTQEVMKKLNEELENCQKSLNINHEIWQFKSCCASQLNLAMSRVGTILANNSSNRNLESRNLVLITMIGLWIFSKIL